MAKDNFVCGEDYLTISRWFDILKSKPLLARKVVKSFTLSSSDLILMLEKAWSEGWVNAKDCHIPSWADSKYHGLKFTENPFRVQP